MPTSSSPATAEHARLAEATGRAEDDLFSREPLVRVGPVPERARLGHRPRGLLRERRRLGIASRTTTPAPARTAGTRTGWPASRTSATSSASRSRSGTARTRSSRSGCSGSPARRATTARTSRSTGGTSRGCRATRCCAGATTTRRSRSRTTRLVHHGRGLQDPELELLDTGAFDDDRYWSVDVTYAKASPTEVLARIVVENHAAGRGDARGAADALVPQHVVVGRRGATAAHRGRRLGARGRRPRARRLPARGRARPRRRAAGGALLRERDERAARLRVGGDHAVPEGRHQRPRRLGRRHGQPGRASAPRPRSATG